MIFSSKIYRQLKARLSRKYSSRSQFTFKTFRKKSNHKLADWVYEHEEELGDMSSFNWFFNKQLEDALFFEHSKVESRPDSIEFSDIEDEIFEKWNNSEFADVFLKGIKKGFSVQKASLETLKVFQDHLIALGERHLLKRDKVFKGYRGQTGLGEIKSGTKILKLLGTTLHLEGKELGLMTSSLKEMKDKSHKIELALNLIRHFSPSSWDRFVAFTDVIIPIKDKEFVSYSQQELPGVSMINLYNRDFVDLLDDLLHENGHHHLNYYLNLEKLIDEPIDLIYYSPWRRSLRPLRGIYHAYFTFFWAFKLFSDMADSKDLETIWYEFSVAEKEKIYWRAVEEFWLLEYSYLDLHWAYKNKLINARGWQLISEQRKELNKFKKKIPLWEKRLKKHKKDLKELKSELKAARKNYNRT